MDFYPAASGKEGAARHLMHKWGVAPAATAFLCDDDNDLALAAVVGKAFLPSISAVSRLAMLWHRSGAGLGVKLDGVQQGSIAWRPQHTAPDAQAGYGACCHCLSDDNNDLALAALAGKAFLPGVSAASISARQKSWGLECLACLEARHGRRCARSCHAC
jgi:hypothetical protein